jgi:pimeloyl-ACP methyl ester carboxylesterase
METLHTKINNLIISKSGILKSFFSLIFILLFSLTSAQKKYDFDVKIVGKGTPIIMIPGFSSSGDVWKETVEHLKNNYECHILTLPGFAGVKPIDGDFLPKMRDEIIAYTKDRKLKNPIIMGHSLGGFLSASIASSEPQLFKKVIIVDGVPFYPAMQNPNITVEQAKSFINKENSIKQFTSMTDEQLKAFSESGAKALVTDPEKVKLVASWQMKSDRTTLGTAFYEMMTTDIRSDLSKIESPVLVLGSKYESLEQSQKILSNLYKNVKNLTLQIADAKHFIMYDNPQWFYDNLDKFLKK